MRTNALDPLISRSVQEILTAVLLERDEPWYFRDLAKRLHRTPSTLQRPLDALVQAGVIKKWADGNRVYFARDVDCPFLADLRGLLEKTVGLVDVLREVLRSYAKSIQVALVYGSVASGKERSASDIDLLVIGRVTLSDLAPALSQAELRLGRPVNATIFSPREFAGKLAKKNHFLQSVLAREKIFVQGTADELDQLAKTGTRGTTRHEQSRAR